MSPRIRDGVYLEDAEEDESRASEPVYPIGWWATPARRHTVIKTREQLRSARDLLGPTLGKRRPTTEQELDECEQILEEMKRLVERDHYKYADFVRTAVDEVSARIRNRKRY